MRNFILLCLILFPGIAYNQVNLNQGLVAYYPFNGNANDVSGNNINGIVNNASLTTDRGGQPNSAYYFNGTSSYIQLPYSSLYNFAPNDSFTLCVRILPDQGNSWPAQALVVKSPFTSDYNLSSWNYGTYMFNYKAMSGYAYNNVVVGNTVFTGNPCWYNIVTTYKNGIWRVYVNGVLEDSDLSLTKYILQDGAASKIAFGKKGDANGDYYKGKMDDIRIYNRLLNLQEIKSLSEISVDAGSDLTVCSSPATVQLNGTTSSNTVYSWTPAAFLNNSTIANPTATINNSTTFYFTSTFATGCAVTDSVKVNIISAPLFQTLDDTSICRGSILTLNTTNGFSTYHWSPGLSVNDSSIANPQFIGTNSQTLVVSGSNGTCNVSDSVKITVKPLPNVNAGRDTIICNSQLITLTASGALSYSWTPVTFLSNPNSPTPVFSGNVSTTYILSGLGTNSCIGKDTITVYINTPNNMIQPPNKSVCSKENVELDGGNGNSFQYLWSPATYLSNVNLINPITNPPDSITYTVLVTDNACNYDSTFRVHVTVMPLPIINADKSNDINCTLKSTQLHASGAKYYSWTPASSLNNPSEANPVATPSTNTEYIVTGTDNNGCKNKGSVKVIVNSGINFYDIPNSFSPNGDGTNDCFGIKNWGLASNVIFIIFNRWGEKVFETNNVNICWDGSFRGQAAEVGNYVYYASARTACGDLVKKGNVLLIR